jgi:hypothetical protein
MASLEAISLLFVFAIMLTYCLGTFSVVHTGILNSIAARAYALESFRNRSDLTYLHDWSENPNGMGVEHYLKYGFRYHGVHSEYGHTGQPEQWATERRIAFGRDDLEVKGRNSGYHAKLTQIAEREDQDVDPVWIKTAYGICLNNSCRGSN